MNYKSIAELNRDIINWLDYLPNDIDMVAGIPRSGMLVASIIAGYTNMALADIDGFAKGCVMGQGDRGVYAYDGKPLKKVLVVDDTVLTGRAITLAKNKLAALKSKYEFVYGAPYIGHESEKFVDFYYKILPSPRVFEWNLMQHHILSNACVDIDGVLCRDPLESENDDGGNYEHFLKNVPARIRPKFKVKYLVTCRLEKYRALTEEWLNKNSIKYESLVMLDLPDKAERLKSSSHAQFKAGIYAKSGTSLFIESSYNQAVEIADISDKIVICTDKSVMVHPGSTAEIKHNLINKYFIAKGMIKYRLNKLKNMCFRGRNEL